MQPILQFLLFLGWLTGIVLAKGFWSTFFALFFPLWAWYLTAEFFIRGVVLSCIL